jgi:glycosyltransferase involved in cell wall biosynthesis
MTVDGNAKPIRVFIHLSYYFGTNTWQKSPPLGINDRLPYGYYRATEDGCLIVYSEDDRMENRLEQRFRLGVKSIIGVDLVHAWRNRKGIYDSDIVWTHTELQYIAVLLLFQIFFWKPRPKLIAQSVWLFDRWHDFSSIKQWLLSWLIKKADLLTVLSPENLKVARSLFPHVRSEFVLFGINADKLTPVKKGKIHHPIRILSLGNDPHRDWQILIHAINDFSDCCLKIASLKVTEEMIYNHTNIEKIIITSNSHLFSAYDWADIVVVALKQNLHASGITVLQEATALGLPVICSDMGGLRAYFSDREIYFIPSGNPAEIQKAISKLAEDDQLRWALVERAQARMKTGGLNSRSYARRHAELSRELLLCDTGRRAESDTGPAA